MVEESEEILSMLEKASKDMLETKGNNEPDDYGTQVGNEQDESFLFEKQPEEKKVDKLRSAWKKIQDVFRLAFYRIKLRLKLDKNLQIDF